MSERNSSSSPFTEERGARRRKAVGERGRALARAREMRRNPAGAYLLSQGFRRLDYYNKAILARPEAVLTSILDAIGGGETGIELALPLTPLPSPPQQRGREQ